MIGARTAAWGRVGLPYDAEVEWLGSDGVAYIDTGVNVSYRDSIKVSIVTTRVSATPCGVEFLDSIFVTSDNSDGRVYLRAFNLSDTIGMNASIGDRVDFVYENQRYYFLLNDREIGNGSSTIASDSNLGSLFVFARNVNGSIKQQGRTKVVEVLVEGMLHLIPVRFTNSLGETEGAMYDRVSGQLFRNSGTGAFVIGPDKT